MLTAFRCSYLHVNGFIHRDVKAANMLIDDDGTVLLGDLGVAASLTDEEPLPTPSGSGQMNFDLLIASDSSSRPKAGPSTKKLTKRKSFVGTVSNRSLFLGISQNWPSKLISSNSSSYPTRPSP